VLHDDLFHPLANVTHFLNLVRLLIGSAGQTMLQSSNGIVVADRGGETPEFGFSLRPAVSSSRLGGYHTSIGLTSIAQSPIYPYADRQFVS
jgi:hypothetical protein